MFEFLERLDEETVLTILVFVILFLIAVLYYYFFYTRIHRKFVKPRKKKLQEEIRNCSRSQEIKKRIELSDEIRDKILKVTKAKKLILKNTTQVYIDFYHQNEITIIYSIYAILQDYLKKVDIDQKFQTNTEVAFNDLTRNYLGALMAINLKSERIRLIEALKTFMDDIKDAIIAIFEKMEFNAIEKSKKDEIVSDLSILCENNKKFVENIHDDPRSVEELAYKNLEIFREFEGWFFDYSDFMDVFSDKEK